MDDIGPDEIGARPFWRNGRDRSGARALARATARRWLDEDDPDDRLLAVIATAARLGWGTNVRPADDGADLEVRSGWVDAGLEAIEDLPAVEALAGALRAEAADRLFAHDLDRSKLPDATE